MAIRGKVSSFALQEANSMSEYGMELGSYIPQFVMGGSHMIIIFLP